MEAVRALIADAVDGQLFTTGRLYMAHVDAYDPYDPAETTALRLAARNRALRDRQLQPHGVQVADRSSCNRRNSS